MDVEQSYNTKKEIIKTCYVFVSPEFIKQNISNNGSYDLIISNLEDPKIKNLFYSHINKLHMDKINCDLADFSQDEIEAIKVKYPEYFSFDMDNVKIRLKNKNKDTVLSKINSTLVLSEDDINQIIDNSINEEKENDLDEVTMIKRI